jgi:hypothetical protein
VSKEQKISIIIFVILSALASFVFYLYKRTDDSVFDFLSVWGSFASLFAFVFLYFAARTQLQLTRDIDSKLLATEQLLTKLFSIADISKGPKIAEQAQIFLRSEKYESALLRVKDLKEVLIQINHYNETYSRVNIENYLTHISNIGIDLSNINDQIIGKKNNINRTKIIKNLEEVSSFISDFELKIKNNGTSAH